MPDLISDQTIEKWTTRFLEDHDVLRNDVVYAHDQTMEDH